MPPLDLNTISIIAGVSTVLATLLMLLRLSDRRKIGKLRQALSLADQMSDELEHQANEQRERAESLSAELSKHRARVEPLQQKYDGLKEGLQEAEQQLSKARQAASMAQEQLSVLQGRFDAKVEELELATQNLHAAYKQREQAIATSMRQTAKFDRIIEVLDPSGTLAEELSGGGE